MSEKASERNEKVSDSQKIDRPDDINAVESKKTGIMGLLENAFRQFKNLGYLLAIAPIGIMYIFCLGFALTPGIYFILKIQEWISFHPQSLIISSFLYGMGFGLAFVFFVFGLILIVPIVNFPLIPFVKAYRGPWISLESIPWYYHNALTYLVRYTILEFLTPTPINVFFFKMMGMKVGKGVMINSTNISDPCLIELDDYVTIGGSAFLMAHYGMKGFLIIDKLHLKKGAMVGLGAKILGGVVVGEKATILPNSAVLPKTVIKDGEKFGVNSTVL